MIAAAGIKIAQNMKICNMKLLILYGSQTGTAEEVSYDLAREAAHRSIESEIFPLDSFPLENLIYQQLAIFVVSTTGQGEPPDNMIVFWRALMNKNLPKTLLENMNFTVFGLGDSTYEQFNAIARKLWIRLTQLGGKGFYRKGLGDEMHDFEYEAEYHPWCEGLWEALAGYFPIINEVEINNELFPPLYVIENVDLAEQSSKRSQLSVVSNQIIAQKYSISRKIVLSGDFSINPGDTCCIYPENNPSEVSKLMELMGWPNNILSISINPSYPLPPKDLPFNSPITLQTLLTAYIDLHKPASRYFIWIISHFADGAQKEKLTEMSSKTTEGRNEYHRYVVKEKRNIIEILWDFTTVRNLPLEYFIEAAGFLKPREFSIASPPGNCGQLEILVSAVEHFTPMGRVVKGLCTHFLAKMQAEEKVSAFVKRGRMPIPPFNAPLIVIATGAGLAPLKSLIYHRIQNNAYDNTLFFGCRHPDYDYLCKDELESLQIKNQLTIYMAFSQVSEHKFYVQNRIKNEWKFFSEKILAGAFVYICGKYRQLGKIIEDATKFTLVQAGIEEDAANDIVQRMKRERRFYLESW
ncbi:unnamed protein product [Blepharisma stoltei]|uniref:NADPH-dependent diflavin oxidoreductase 1 n=1 Tax=Blepharisma stoltei TaxID=1481888 RepID=A0AAU9ISH6_9CILI|nr:unnamed protein product [Blepharisma stoltei]